MKNFLNKTKKSNFYKLLILFIIAVSVPSVCIAALSIKHSSDNIIVQGSKASVSILMEKKFSLNQRLNEFDNLIFNLASNKQIWDLFRTDKSSYIDQFKIQEVIKLIISGEAMNNIIQSIYIYDDNHDSILSKTKSTKEDFYDRSVLNIKFDGSLFIGIRQVELPGELVSRKVVSYIRKFNDIGYGNNVWFIINIDYEKFFNFLEAENYETPKGFLICDKNYAAIYSNIDSPDKIIRQAELKEITKGNDNTVKKINGKKYLVCKTDSNISDWTLMFIQPYEELAQTAKLIINLIVYSFLIILVLGCIMAYFFSVNLYKPIERLVADIAGYSEAITPQSSFKYNSNEYKIIDGAIRKLFIQNSELHLKYKMTFPYFKDNFLYSLLLNRSFDTEKFTSFLDMLGICFTHSRFVCIVTDFENKEFTDEIRIMHESYFNNYIDGLNYIISHINESRIVVIVNTEYDYEMIYSIMSKLKDILNSVNIQITLSMGKLYDDMDKIYISYTEAMRQIENKFFIGKNEIIQYNGDKSVNKMFFYEKKLEDEMINHIKSQNLGSAVNSLEKLTQELINKSSSIEYIKCVYFQVINNIVYGLEDIGVKPAEAEMSNTYIFEKINEAETYKELQLFANMFIEKNISLLKNLKDMKHNAMVNKTIDFINKNFMNNLSLEEIAQEIFISPRYLNSIFKAQTGMTIFEYVTEQRMEKARSLIANENIKIQDIAKEVGYNNVQGFFRLFKKCYKMTPIEYRRKCTLDLCK